MSFKKNKTAEKPNQPPVDEIRIGLQKASIWENETKDGTFYSVSFDRRYQDEKGDWHSASGYGLRDLLVLSKLADLAHTRIVEAMQSENNETEEA